MTIREVLNESTVQLKAAGVELPHLDAVLLIAHVLNISKEYVYVRLPDEITESAIHHVKKLIKQRCKGIPVSYLRNKKEFYSNEFFVDERVLVPRPDTEIIVEEAANFIRTHKTCQKILDVCTGSGCIAITLAQLFPSLHIIASDISKNAGEVFLKNSQSILNNPIEFIESDLFDNISGTFDCIIANPPYVTHAEVNDMKAHGWPEPELALDGGADGTDVLFKIIDRAFQYLNNEGALFLEAASPQMEKLEHRMQKYEYINIRIICDLGNRKRVITGIRKEK